MKKYITIAALLAAGSAFANAAETLVEFDLSRNDNAISFEETDDVLSFTYDSKAYNTGGNKSGGWQSPENAAYQNTFSPDVQLRKGEDDYWTFTFTVTNSGEKAITLTSISFSAYGIDGGGGDKRTAVIPVSAWLNDASTTINNLGIQGSTSAATFTTNTVLQARESEQFTFKLGNVKNYNTYAGLTGGSVTYSAVPEPSAFGLLAGIGALALVASRRRRK